MLTKLSRIWFNAALPIALLICMLVTINIRLSKHFWTYSIISDGKGYYAYLPATFIYNDLNFNFRDSIEARYNDAHNQADYRIVVDGFTANKYFCGTALLQTPFFLAGHLTAKLTGATADGYSKPYIVWTHIGALFYLALGLYALRRFLLSYFHQPIAATSVVLIILFGTNLFYYAIAEPMMSHVYSFALLSCFMLQTRQWMQTGQNKSLLLMMLLLGLIALVRPVNLLITGWIFIEGQTTQQLLGRFQVVFKNFKLLLSSFLLFTGIIFIQFIIWKIQTGHWYINSYGNEGFDFTSFHFTEFLFSYRKGLFIYTPLTLLALGGFYFLYRNNKNKAILTAIFLLIVVYILSSWWMWFYGGSFGSRPMIEYLPVFALLLYFLITAMKRQVSKLSLAAVLFILVAFCQLQTLQYRYEIIHWSEMNKEVYWDVFLKLKK
jgi:hypothetical protein